MLYGSPQHEVTLLAADLFRITGKLDRKASCYSLTHIENDCDVSVVKILTSQCFRGRHPICAFLCVFSCLQKGILGFTQKNAFCHFYP